MSVKWTARAVPAMVTLAPMTQPGLAAARAKHSAHAKASAHVAEGPASKRQIDAIEKRGEDVSAGVRVKFEPRIAALAQQVDVELESNPTSVIQRLSNEFGVKSEALTREHDACGGSWGDLMIARTLRANVRFAITVKQVFDLHEQGMSWTMVAHGLGLGIEPFVSAVETESHVAIGQLPADGKVLSIGPG